MRAILLVCMSLLLVLLFSLNMMIGSAEIDLGTLVSVFFGESNDTQVQTIVWSFRFPKAITAILAGVALSVSGLQMQTLFRNPLAGPYVLGISAGAGLGVALLIMGSGLLGLASLAYNALGLIVAAWVGAGLVLLLVFAVSVRLKDVMTVLILGVMCGSAITAIVSILQYFSNAESLKAFITWTLGDLGGVTKNEITWLAPVICFGFLLALFSMKSLNSLLMGENYSRTIGVNIIRSRILIILSTAILAGSITAFCGPIGFIGIAVPHLCRMLFNSSDHRFLIPASALIGANFMLLSDIVSRVSIGYEVLPINAVTAILGAPFVIWVILRKGNIKSSFSG